MGKGALLLVFGASVVFTVMNLQLNKAAEQANQNLVGYFEQSMAAAIADQSAEYLLTMLADSSTWRVHTMTMLNPEVIGVDGDFSVLYSIRNVEKKIREWQKKAIELRVEARYGRRTDTVTVYLSRQFGFVPLTVRGAITAAGVLNKTVADMVIDGRNHDLGGALDPTEQGVFGISSGMPFWNTGGAIIGGMDADGVNRPPARPYPKGIVEERWNGDFPQTPDEVVGTAEGFLKTLAQSGIEGSQYATNPLALKFPLRGITYVELPYGVSWGGPDLSGSQGLLIVHNSSGNARLENANTKETGFQGLIIADYVFHFHMDVLGAVVLLSPKLEVFKQCLGNKDHSVIYSVDAVKRATHVILKRGSGWNGRVPILGWRH
ncbi:MAG: hypothetical protein HBSIN02_18840 [Bacteroidia bacterium]|nr:MAG: hypothetical protein HBSIN02_18840 [Bacteroidia bacterium]